MIKKDVVIIGAGVAGLYLSRLLEKKGIDYITFERNRQIGKYGNRIISNTAFKKLGVSKKVIIENIKKMDFISPGGVKISIKSKKSRGYVTNIGFLEKELFSTIKDKSRIIFNHSVESIDLDKGYMKVNDYEIKARVIIFATGIPRDRLGKKILKVKPRIVFCHVSEIKGRDKIVTILDNEKAHGFYAWVIPLKDHIEVGFGTDRYRKIKGSDFNKILFKLPHIGRYKKNKKIKQFGGFIPTSLVRKRCGKNWILIGDASGGEAMMGGSIHKSVDEALMASKAIKLFLNNNIYSLNEYDKLWNKSLGRDFYKQEKIRSILDKSSNKIIDKAFKIAQEKKIEGEGLINNLFKNIILNLIKLKNFNKNKKG